MKLFTAQEMRSADKAAEEAGIPTLLLMEAAGQAVAEAALGYWPEARRVLVLSGKGNNGGDGYVAARHLLKKCHATVLELSISQEDLKSSDARTMRAAWLAHQEARSEPLQAEALRLALKEHDLVIDALFGSGLVRPLEGELAEVVKVVNESDLPVLSIDLPSGLNSDTGDVIGPHIKAQRTLQLAGPKRASAFFPAQEAFGTWEVADIGIPAEILEAQSGVELLTSQSVRRDLPTRENNTHKYRVGTVLVIAGSERYQGAAQLTCRGALRGGAGLVTLASGARSVNAWPEIIFEEISDWNDGLKQILAMPERRRQVLVIGPGLSPEALPLLPELLRKTRAPTVLDASALSGEEAWFEAVREHGRCVLTPHAGEASGLLDKSAKEILKDPLQASAELAQRSRATIVLKGMPSIIAAPDGRIAVSPRGHPGMATGGSGDVLSGLLGAWLAAGEALFERVSACVFTHGVAGEIAAEHYGDGLIASDLSAFFPQAWQETLYDRLA